MMVTKGASSADRKAAKKKLGVLARKDKVQKEQTQKEPKTKAIRKKKGPPFKGKTSDNHSEKNIKMKRSIMR
jgi:hypothetical protein